MHSQKLSSLSRAFVFGGAYGNLQATQAILNEARLRGFHPNEVIFTGDLVAYCGQPQETVDAVREFGCHLIQGNCEEALAQGAQDCGCGFETGTACNLLSDQWFKFCNDSLTQETKQWMGTLPKMMTITMGGYRLFVTHGTPERINQFVFPSDFDNGQYQVPPNRTVDAYIVGHCGIPFVAQQNGKMWINSGAAGMPANDGTARVWFATLELTKGVLSAEIHSVEYDHGAASHAMISAGMSNGYCECLKSGIWPSHDILPTTEHAMTGIPIIPQKKALIKAPLVESKT